MHVAARGGGGEANCRHQVSLPARLRTHLTVGRQGRVGCAVQCGVRVVCKSRHVRLPPLAPYRRCARASARGGESRWRGRQPTREVQVVRVARRARGGVCAVCVVLHPERVSAQRQFSLPRREASPAQAVWKRKVCTKVVWGVQNRSTITARTGYVHQCKAPERSDMA